MQSYIEKFESFEKQIVYDFQLGSGGIGDCIKFFMFILDVCIKNNERLYYKKNNILIEKYIKLKHSCMYIDEHEIKHLNCFEIVRPCQYYNTFNTNYSVDIKDVFYFSDKVKINTTYIFPPNVEDYISIHLRLGDKYLETDNCFIACKNDERVFSLENLYKLIDENHDKCIFFCCDNNNFKLNLQKKYNSLIITHCLVGHSSFSNTTEKEVLDAITEFYILTNSKIIFGASQSGFSQIASKFNNIPYIELPM